MWSKKRPKSASEEKQKKQDKGVTSILASPLSYNDGQCPSLGRFEELDVDDFMTSIFARDWNCDIKNLQGPDIRACLWRQLYSNGSNVLIEKWPKNQIENRDQNEKSGFGLPPASSTFGGKPNALLALLQVHLCIQMRCLPYTKCTHFCPNPHNDAVTIISAFLSDNPG